LHFGPDNSFTQRALKTYNSASVQMGDNDNNEMPGFPGRIIKFGTFNVTSQVQAFLTDH
jgi:hypothetical protein